MILAKNIFVSLTLIALASACANRSESKSSDQILRDATVKEVATPAVFSGIVATFIEIKVNQDGSVVSLLYPYMDAKQDVPKLESRCNFGYEERPVDGQTANRTLNGEIGKVVVAIKCK